MILPRELRKNRFCNIVVATPVGRAFGEGELVHVVSARLGGDGGGGRVDRLGILHEVAASAVGLDQGDFSFEVLAGITATNGSPSMRAK